MRPCRSEAKQLRCICSGCACETAKAFSQDPSDPLGPRDGLRPGGNRHEVLAGRRSPSRRNLAFGRGKQKNRSAIDRARLTQSFWVEHMVSLRALSFCDDQPCRRRGEGVGWGQASLRGSLPQASSRTEACHTHRGGPTLLPRFRKRASVGTDACRGRCASRTRTIGEAKKALQTGEIGHRILMRRASFCCQRHCHSCFWLFSAYIQLPMLNHPNWALKT